MGDKNVAQVHPVITSMPDLPQNRIAAPAIHQEGLPALLQQKASIITLRHKRIARAQHRQLHRETGDGSLSPLSSRFFTLSSIIIDKKACYNQNRGETENRPLSPSCLLFYFVQHYSCRIPEYVPDFKNSSYSSSLAVVRVKIARM